jgi:hypothetical protein
MAWVRIDEHFYDHPRWCDAPGDSIALWLAAMAWCNRTDSVEGLIPRGQCAGLVNVRNLKTTLRDLVGRGAFEDTPAGFLIHDYVEFQQPEKVRKLAETRAAAGRKGAEARWGEYRRARDYADAPPIDDAIASGMANAIAKTCPDTDTDTVAITSSSVSTVVPIRPVDDDDDFARVVGIVLEGRWREYATTIRNERAWRATVRRQIIAEDGPLIRRMLADDGVEQVAAFVLGYGDTAAQAREYAPIAWCDTDCPECGGDNFVYPDDPTVAHPCPNRAERQPVRAKEQR